MTSVRGWVAFFYEVGIEKELQLDSLECDSWCIHTRSGVCGSIPLRSITVEGSGWWVKVVFRQLDLKDYWYGLRLGSIRHVIIVFFIIFGCKAKTLMISRKKSRANRFFFHEYNETEIEVLLIERKLI